MHADRHTSRGVYTMFWTLTEIYQYVKYIQYNSYITYWMFNQI